MVYEFKNSYDTFTRKLSKLKEECAEIVEKNAVRSEEELFKLTDQWESKVEKYVRQNISPVPEFLVENFKYSSYGRLSDEIRFRYGRKETEEELNELYNDIIKSKLRSLQILEDYFLILNSVHQNPQNEINTIQQKLDYIMDKLYLVFNDNLYSIEYLLELNDVSYRSGEPQELGKNLYKKGYIEVADEYTKTHLGKLTVKGASYVERKKKSTGKKRTLKREKELNEKVDIVLEKLQKLGYGQEIIFEEIEELKSLSGKLKKKTWIQLLKGKVVDLAMEQVINKETASYILETFTEEASKLLPK